MAAAKRGTGGGKGGKKGAKKAASRASKAKSAGKAVKKALKGRPKSPAKAVKKAAESTSTSKGKSAARSRPKSAARAAVSKPSKKSATNRKSRTRKETAVSSKRNFDKIKEKLLERRKQLLADLGKLTGSATEASSRPVGDRVDDAVTDLQVDSSYAIAEQETRELKLIDAALENIEDGTYGICEECGEAIGKSRLKALPYAVLCLSCKEQEEMERASSGY